MREGGKGKRKAGIKGRENAEGRKEGRKEKRDAWEGWNSSGARERYRRTGNAIRGGVGGESQPRSTDR